MAKWRQDLSTSLVSANLKGASGSTIVLIKALFLECVCVWGGGGGGGVVFRFPLRILCSGDSIKKKNAPWEESLIFKSDHKSTVRFSIYNQSMNVFGSGKNELKLLGLFEWTIPNNVQKRWVNIASGLFQ